MRSWRWRTERRMFWLRTRDCPDCTVYISLRSVQTMSKGLEIYAGPAKAWLQNHARNYRRPWKSGHFSFKTSAHDVACIRLLDSSHRRKCRSRGRSRRTRLGVSSGNAFVVRAFGKNRKSIWRVQLLNASAAMRSLTAERVATLLAQLKDKQALKASISEYFQNF